MSESVRERIMQDCVASLSAINGTGDYETALATIKRGRLTPEDALPAAALLEGDEEITEGPAPLVTRKLPVTLELRAQSADEVLATVANRLLADGERALLADPSRGGLAVDTCITGNSATTDEGPGVLASVEIPLEIHYRTVRGDPATAG